MSALWYLRKQIWKNRIRKALRKPVTYIYIILGVAYLALILFGIGSGVKNLRIDSEYGFLIVVMLLTFYVTLGNFSGYADKKGILFKPCQSHFVFTSPIHPKLILLDSAWLNFLVSFILYLVVTVAGLTIFQLSVLKMLLFFVVCYVLEVVLETGLIVVLYGSDWMARKHINYIGKLMKGIAVISILLLAWYLKVNGVSMETAMMIVDHPAVQLFPVIGWNIAAFRLILFGPTALNVICSGLYAASVALAAILAWKMKCTGEYFEDAAKFADDYAEFRQKNKGGEASFSIGKKKRFKTGKVEYRGHGARAIFYRQLLEYKKEKFFLFNYMTLVCTGLAVILGYTWRDAAGKPQAGLYMLGILAYMALITTGYAGKWDKELKNPYLYLIPDRPLKKLWYSTCMDHVKAVIDGTLNCVLLGVMWSVPAWQIVCSILIYVVLQANKMYMKVFATMLLGDTLGKTGKDILRVVIQSSTMGIGIVIALAAALFMNYDLVFLILLVYSIIITMAVALLASMKFEVLEQAD